MELILSADSLAVFVDDTGDELLQDPFQKVFGLGGCAVMGSNLDKVIRQPWREVRREIAGSPDKPLHATDVHPSSEQIETISSFFKTQPFARFGAICSVETDLDRDLAPLIVTVETLKRRILEILKWQPFRSVEIVFEHSQRLAQKIEAAFAGFSLEENGQSINVGLSWLPKAAHEPALEVADFLANTIGTQVRHRIANKPGFAKNFAAFFQHPGRRLVSFIDILEAKRRQNGGRNDSTQDITN